MSEVDNSRSDSIRSRGMRVFSPFASRSVTLAPSCSAMIPVRTTSSVVRTAYWHVLRADDRGRIDDAGEEPGGVGAARVRQVGADVAALAEQLVARRRSAWRRAPCRAPHRRCRPAGRWRTGAPRRASPRACRASRSPSACGRAASMSLIAEQREQPDLLDRHVGGRDRPDFDEREERLRPLLAAEEDFACARLERGWAASGTPSRSRRRRPAPPTRARTARARFCTSASVAERDAAGRPERSPRRRVLRARRGVRRGVAGASSGRRGRRETRSRASPIAGPQGEPRGDFARPRARPRGSDAASASSGVSGSYFRAASAARFPARRARRTARPARPSAVRPPARPARGRGLRAATSARSRSTASSSSVCGAGTRWRCPPRRSGGRAGRGSPAPACTLAVLASTRRTRSRARGRTIALLSIAHQSSHGMTGSVASTSRSKSRSITGSACSPGSRFAVQRSCARTTGLGSFAASSANRFASERRHRSSRRRAAAPSRPGRTRRDAVSISAASSSSSPPVTCSAHSPCSASRASFC